jgi:hypothetical protein
MDHLLPIFWNLPAPQVCEQRGSAPQGRSTAQAKIVRARYGPNALRSTHSLRVCACCSNSSRAQCP